MIRTIKLQIEVPRAGEAGIAKERGWLGKGVGFQHHRASATLPPAVGEFTASSSMSVCAGQAGNPRLIDGCLQLGKDIIAHW